MTTNDDKSAPVRPVGPMGLIDECNCGGLGDGDSFSHDEDCPEGERLVRAYEEERDAPPAQPVTGCGKRMGGGLAPLKCGERTELRTVLCIDCSPAQPVTEPPKSVVTGETSDGYHTFNELYEHRFALWMALCRFVGGAWRSWLHSDGTFYNGWFVLGIGVPAGEQITYHLPLRLWDETDFAVTTDRCPVFDGHTSADVIKRIAALRPVTAQPVREQGEADQQPPAVLPVETPPAEPSGNPGELPPRLRWDTWMVDGERFVLYVRARDRAGVLEGWRCFDGEWLADDCFVTGRARLISRAAPATPDTPPEDVPQSGPTAGPGPTPIGGLEDALRCGRIWAESGSLHLSVPEHSAAVLAREVVRLRAAAPPRKTPGELELRPEVLAFAQLMEAKLRDNDHKGGWKHCTTRYLSVRLGHELEELRRVLSERTKSIGKFPRNLAVESDLARVIGNEAADVANFAMMVADVCGALITADRGGR